MKYPLIILAWFGGRSFKEIKGRSEQEYDTSVMVGGFCLVSTGMIAGGHFLFWGHLPHTAEAASWIALAVTLLYSLFYRNVIRVQETLGGVKKFFVVVSAFGLVATNTLLTGHEWVLLAFKPQVEAQAANNAARGVIEYRDLLEGSLRLPQLRSDRKSIGETLLAQQLERERIPNAVSDLQNQAQQCDGIVKKLRLKMNNQDDLYQQKLIKGKLDAQRARCQAMRDESGRLLHKHQSDIDERITELDRNRRELDSKVVKANADEQADFDHQAPTLNASATTGFARHRALWAAVENELVPRWAVVGLMFSVLVLEGMSFLAKLLLSADEATWDRRNGVSQVDMLGKMREALGKINARQIRGVAENMASILAEDVARDMRNVVAPGLRLEIAARAYAKANASVDCAQREAGKASPDLVRDLSDLDKARRATVAPLRPAQNDGGRSN